MAVSLREVDGTNISEQEISLLREQIWRMRHPDAEEREPLWPDTCFPKEKSLADVGVQRIYEWESESTWFRAYEVELFKFTGFKFIVDFSGTTNHDIQGTFGVQDLVVEANLQPFEMETICLVSRNKLDPFKFSASVKWTTTEVHPAIVETALAMNHNRVRAEFDMMQKVGIDMSMNTSELIDSLIHEQLLFVDEDFYPSPASLYIDADDSELVAEEQVMWRRASDFCRDPAVFRGGIEPSDVAQGRLGDCWFCCSLASMSERPKLIERLFVTKVYAEVGLYEVRFCHNGLWKVVLLDDFIPCRPFQGPIYTKTGDDELWVALLEKAYAKIYGCYERLVAGNPYHALPDLTGCPASIYELHDPDDVEGLWDKLLDWNDTEHNLMSGACDETSLMEPTTAGLMLDHSYTILDARQWDGVSPSVRLVCMRNPWGHGEWQGQWSDEDDRNWTRAALEYFQPSRDPEDGTFWMSYDDFLRYFTTLTVAYCRPDFVDARIGSDMAFDFDTSELTVPVIRLTVPRGGKCEFLGMYQQDFREEGAPGYLDLAMFVFEEDSAGGRRPVAYVKMESARHQFQAFGSESDLFTRYLPEGNYLLVPYTSGVHWDPESGPTRAISLSAHVHSTVLKPTMKVVAGYTKDELDDALLEFVMELGDKRIWNKLERRHLRVGQMDIYAGRNLSTDKVITFSMKGDLENIVNALGYPVLAEGCAFDIQPGAASIFGIQVMEDPKAAGSSAYKFGYKHKAAVKK